MKSAGRDAVGDTLYTCPGWYSTWYEVAKAWEHYSELDVETSDVTNLEATVPCCRQDLSWHILNVGISFERIALWTICVRNLASKDCSDSSGVFFFFTFWPMSHHLLPDGATLVLYSSISTNDNAIANINVSVLLLKWWMLPSAGYAVPESDQF